MPCGRWNWSCLTGDPSKNSAKNCAMRSCNEVACGLLTLSNSHLIDEEDVFRKWSCPVPCLLQLLRDCVALENLELKGMLMTSDMITTLEQRLPASPLRDATLLKQLKLGHCNLSIGFELAALGRLLTTVFTGLQVVHLPFQVGSLNLQGVIVFVNHMAQLSQLQSLTLICNGSSVKACQADLLVKLAKECPVFLAASGLTFGTEVQIAKVTLEHLFQMNFYVRRWVDRPTTTTSFPPALWVTVLAKAIRDGAIDASRFLLLRRVADLVGTTAPQSQGRKRPSPFSSSSPAEPSSAKRIGAPRVSISTSLHAD